MKAASEDWATVAQVRDALGVSTKTIYNRIDAGDIPAHQVGRTFMIPRSWLEAAISAPQVCHTDFRAALDAFVAELARHDEAGGAL